MDYRDMTCDTCGQMSLEPREPQYLLPDTVRDLLGRNDEPPESEKSRLQSIVDQSAKLFSELDLQTAHALEALDRLRYERGIAEVNLKDATDMLHPARRFPDDILHEIFLLCSPTKDDTRCLPPANIGFSLDPTFPPWTLSQVCRRWRRIAIYSPQLWAPLVLSLHSALSHRAYLYKLGLRLQRVRDGDLYVAFVGLNYESMDGHPAMAVLELSTSQWRSCRLMSSTSLRSFLGCDFSRLEFLHVNSTATPSLGVVETFNNAQQLTFFHVAGGAQNLKSFRIHTKSIRTYRGYDSFGVDKQSVLEQMPLLADCRLVIRHLISPPSKIRCRELRSLFLYDALSASEDFSKCLDGWEIPILASLGFQFMPGRAASFPKKTFPPTLTTLIIKQDYLDDSDVLIHFLKFVESVEELCIGGENVHAPFWGLLRIQQNNHSLLPNLRVLDVRDCVYTHSPPDAFKGLMKAIKSRILNGKLEEEVEGGDGSGSRSFTTLEVFRLSPNLAGRLSKSTVAGVKGLWGDLQSRLDIRVSRPLTFVL